MLFAEQFTTLPTIDSSIRSVQPFPTHRLGASIVRPWSLPVIFGDNVIRNDPGRFWRSHGCRSWRCCRRGTGLCNDFVRLENIKTFQLLIEDCKGLKFFGLDHLRLEPVLNLILLDLFQVFVVIVEMPLADSVSLQLKCLAVIPVELQQRHLVPNVRVCTIEGSLPSLTISSLHIGHASLELAAAEVATLMCSLFSSDILDLMSCCSCEVYEVEAEESSEMELADGDSKLEFRLGRGELAGDKERPLPKTLPPPSFLPDMISPVDSRKLSRSKATKTCPVG